MRSLPLRIHSSPARTDVALPSLGWYVPILGGNSASPAMTSTPMTVAIFCFRFITLPNAYFRLKTPRTRPALPSSTSTAPAWYLACNESAPGGCLTSSDNWSP